MRTDSATRLFRELDRKAQVEFRLGEFAAAAEEFHKAACMAPESFRTYYEGFEVATRDAAKRDYSAARQVLQETDQLRPDYPLALAMLVEVDLIAGEIIGLKECLTLAAQRFPQDGRLHVNLTQDLIRGKQLDLALAEALRAEASGALDRKIELNLAVLENQAGDYGDAAHHASSIEQDVQAPPKLRAAAAAVTGLSFEGLTQSQEAIRHLNIAIQLDPDREQPYLSLARIYARLPEVPAELAILSQAHKRIGGSPELLLRLASTLIASEQYQPAVQILTNIKEKFPDEFEAYLKLAETYRGLGEPKRATSTLEELALRKPGDPMVHLVIARSLLDEPSVDYPRVLERLTVAERLSPEDYDIHYLRGKAFVALGNYAKAVDALRRAIRLKPMDPSAHYQLAAAYRKLGRSNLADEELGTSKYLQESTALLTGPQ